MRRWEYAAIIHVEFAFPGQDPQYPEVLDRRWVLTASTSSTFFRLENHPKLKDLATKCFNAWKMQDKNKVKIRDRRNKEFYRILKDNELPNSIFISEEWEDDLDLIRTASEYGWETTGRTPGGNLTMMRRQIT